jgi:shikimate kinase
MSLFLIGLRGAGKSAVGARAAERLGVPHLDSDQLIEARSGRTVAELFRDQGEPCFRALERELLLEELPRPGRIVSTGGGCILDPQVRATLQARGVTVWLRAPVATLQRRLACSAPRPSLTGAPPAAELEELLARRQKLYQECAHHVVETDGRSLDEVAHVIEQLWPVPPHQHLR